MSKRAFTLVEMLIVIVIIGILAAALIPRLTGIQARARDTARETGLTAVAQALEMYSVDEDGLYPNVNGATNNATLTGVAQYLEGSKFPNNSAKGLTTTDGSTCAKNDTDKTYSYASKDGGRAYVVTVMMETPSASNTDDCGGGADGNGEDTVDSYKGGLKNRTKGKIN